TMTDLQTVTLNFAIDFTDTASGAPVHATMVQTFTVFKPQLQTDAGGTAVGSFQADAGFTGGAAYRTSAVLNTTGVPTPAPQARYQSERYGNFSYKATGLTSGSTYTVRLHFAEVYFNSPGKRLFNVTINGIPVLTRFDIFAQAGGMNQAL